MDELKSEVPCVFENEYCKRYTGKQAANFLKTKLIEESKFLDPQRGVTAVDKNRWEEAQRYERRTWMDKCKDMVSDHNEHNCKRFGSFLLLKDLKFKRAIELGCGPFTNMRLLLDCVDVKETYLLDPLMESYLDHSYCSYRRSRLGGIIKCWPTLHELEKPIRFLKRKFLECRIGGLWGRCVNLIPSAIEFYQTDLKFDLIVMINVLEHCQDADAVLEKILRIIAPGGILVFGEVMYEVDEVNRLSSIHYNAGHPLKVTYQVIESYLSESFDTLMKSYYPTVQYCHGVYLKNTELYFIGKRKPF
ncbi:MAG: class I SAM-dependent methyltransferase [Thermotogota bacterium]|nr:class I SAM-dependent methyltransferase [Thermotogota bacterium]